MEVSDIWYAYELGYTLKLEKYCEKAENMIELRVHQPSSPHDHPLSSVNGVFNAIVLGQRGRKRCSTEEAPARSFYSVGIYVVFLESLC